MANKKKSWIIWSIFGVLLFAVFAAATTTLSSAGIVTINGTFSGDNNITGNVHIGGDMDLIGGSSGITISSNGGGVYGTDDTLIHLKPDNPQAKPDIAWDGYYDNGTEVVYQSGVGWWVCHYNTSINSDAHQHCSFETFDTDNNNLNTRFAIEYGKAEDDLLVYVNKVKAFRLNKGVDFYTKDTTNIFPEEQEAVAFNISIYDNSPQISAIGSAKTYIESDLTFKGETSDIKATAELDIYPYDGSTSFRISTDTGAAGGIPRISATGSSVLDIADSINVIGGAEISGTVNITADNAYINGDASNQDSYIYMWDETSSAFQHMMFDKFDYPGLPTAGVADTGFVFSKEVYVTGNLETSEDLILADNIERAGDTNTEIQGTADQWNFVTGASSRFTVNNNGVQISNGDLDLNSNDITEVSNITIEQTLKLTPISAAPTGSEGMLYADSDTNELCYYNSTHWVGLVGGGTCE